MAHRATSLGPKPSLFFWFLFFWFFVVFFGGFKGQVRWPKGPPHLALNPPYSFVFVFFLFLFFFSLLYFLCFLIDKKPVFPLKKAFFVYFQCLPLFLFSLFWASPFLPFLFLCLCLVIVFLPSFLFFIFSFWFLLFLFVVFAFFCFKMFFCFCFSACCLVLFSIITFHLFLLCILFSGCCFFVLLLSYFVIF